MENVSFKLYQYFRQTKPGTTDKVDLSIRCISSQCCDLLLLHRAPLLLPQQYVGMAHTTVDYKLYYNLADTSVSSDCSAEIERLFPTEIG